MSFDKMIFHPLFVHFPIALCFFELGLIMLSRSKEPTVLSQHALSFARLTLRVTAAILPVVLLTGWRDAGGTFQDLFEGGVKPHFYAACGLTGVVVTRLLLWKVFPPEHSRCFKVQLLTGLVMMTAVVVTAYWGGKLVYG